MRRLAGHSAGRQEPCQTPPAPAHASGADSSITMQAGKGLSAGLLRIDEQTCRPMRGRYQLRLASVLARVREPRVGTRVAEPRTPPHGPPWQGKEAAST